MTHDNFGAAAPETKAYGPDANAAQARLMEAFEAFKDANDQRLGEIERKLSADVLTAEKVERINRAVGEQKAALERLSLDLKRPHGAPAPRAPLAPGERKQAFDAYLRTGDAGELVRLESKSGPLIAGADADGGYLAPDETERTIERLLRDVSPIRAIASVRQTSANTLRKPVARQGFASGWAAETASRPQTDTTDFEVVDFPAMELYAMPAATPQLLDDALVNVEQWIAEEVQEAFAAQESQAFVNGDGTAKPRGFLSYTNVADASWAWGQIGFVASGAAGDFAASNPVDRLIDLAYAPKQVYRANARFVMNRLTEARVRKLKDSDGDYFWQPGMSAGAPATLLGFPVTEAEAMPNVAANSFSIAFGDFARGYLIVDRAGVRILRDPYSAKPYVLFYTTKRVGGGVQNFEAIKLMKFSAS